MNRRVPLTQKKPLQQSPISISEISLAITYRYSSVLPVKLPNSWKKEKNGIYRSEPTALHFIIIIISKNLQFLYSYIFLYKVSNMPRNIVLPTREWSDVQN